MRNLLRAIRGTMTTNTQIRIAIVACAAVAAPCLGGAAYVEAAPDITLVADKSCNLGFIPAKPTVGVGSIIGNAWAKCDVAPEQHTLAISLERRDGGAWVTEATNRDHTIPAPRAVYAVKTVCKPGVWRVVATAAGSLGGNDFAFTDFSMERFVTPDDCAR